MINNIPGVNMNNKRKILVIISIVIFVLIAATELVYLTVNNKPNKASSNTTKVTAQSTVATPSVNSNSTAGAVSQQETPTQAAVQKPDSSGLQLKPSIEQVKIKAVYLTGPSASLSKKVDSIIEIAKKTELNAVVIDIKEDGLVNYQSNVPMVKQYGLEIKYYNPEKLIKKFHENGIYVIGRIVTFKDSRIATKRADLAIKNSNGQIWKENGTTPWLNPYNKETWAYNIAIAKEAVSKGFDEIQFDYVRFPTGKTSEFNYGQNPPPKSEAINGFLAEAQKEIYQKYNVPISADVFAIITESKGDAEKIGQKIEEVGKDIYCINPMIYPSHYANNAKKGVMANGVGQKINGVSFTKPDLEPYKVVYNALLSAKTKTSSVTGYKAKIRPYIQAFTAKYLPAGYFQVYGPEQIKQQIKAVYDAGYQEWILWDPRNNYQESYFQKEQ